MPSRACASRAQAVGIDLQLRRAASQITNGGPNVLDHRGPLVFGSKAVAHGRREEPFLGERFAHRRHILPLARDPCASMNHEDGRLGLAGKRLGMVNVHLQPFAPRLRIHYVPIDAAHQEGQYKRTTPHVIILTL